MPRCLTEVDKRETCERRLRETKQDGSRRCWRSRKGDGEVSPDARPDGASSSSDNDEREKRMDFSGCRRRQMSHYISSSELPARNNVHPCQGLHWTCWMISLFACLELPTQILLAATASIVSLHRIILALSSCPELLHGLFRLFTALSSLSLLGCCSLRYLDLCICSACWSKQSCCK